MNHSQEILDILEKDPMLQAEILKEKELPLVTIMLVRWTYFEDFSVCIINKEKGFVTDYTFQEEKEALAAYSRMIV